jgi:hypothetical protein
VTARRAWAGAAVLAIVVAASFGGASEVRAAPTAGAICKSFSRSGLKYQWSAIGGVTCKKAKPWLLKLLRDRVRTPSMKVALKNGPKGFHCYATIVTKSRASAGVCYTGTFKFPKNGFQWFGS